MSLKFCFFLRLVFKSGIWWHEYTWWISKLVFNVCKTFCGYFWQHKPTVYSLIIWSTLWSTLGLTKIFDELVIIFRKGCGVWTFPTLFPSFSIQIIFPSLGSSFLKSFHKLVSKLFWLGCGPTTPRIVWPQLCSLKELKWFVVDI